MNIIKSNLFRMIARRIALSFIILVLVTMLVFLIMQAVPGDPIANYLGDRATPETIAHYTELFGLDQPVFVQYFRWMTGLFRGELGRSVIWQIDVTELLPQRIAPTLVLVFPAFILAAFFGTLLGTLAALNRGKLIDNIVSLLANIGMSTPIFWIGIMGILIFGLSLGILPVQGYVPPTQDFVESVRRLIMPVVVMSLGPLSVFARQTRSALLEVIRQDYVRTAEAKGLMRKNIILKHQLRNALIPIITVMGTQLGFMVSSTVLIESVFAIPGLGSLMISSVRGNDFFVVQSVVLVFAVVVCVCNLVVDILYGIIDPRIRDTKTGG